MSMSKQMSYVDMMEYYDNLCDKLRGAIADLNKTLVEFTNEKGLSPNMSDTGKLIDAIKSVEKAKKGLTNL